MITPFTVAALLCSTGVSAQLGGGGTGVPGGWSPVDLSNQRFIEATNYAVSHKFGAETKGTAVAGMTQVVTGINYDITAKVEPKAGGCSVERFVVWDKFGDFSLTKWDHVADNC
jgi:hypothetical protein